MWQHDALERLEPGETIDKLLYGGYSTISLGYAGLWETVFKLNGHKLTEPEGEELGLKIMQYMNDKCEKWKKAENLGYSTYGTPLESTTEREMFIIVLLSFLEIRTSPWILHIVTSSIPVVFFLKIDILSLRTFIE